MKYKIADLQTEQIVQHIKNSFVKKLQNELQLHPVFAPLYVKAGTGLNDNLNGTEKPVSFCTSSDSFEIVHSLAKWKRMRLQELNVPLHQGIVTHMIALRPDEVRTNKHSILVDQWDWEMHIGEQDRTLDFLKKMVGNIYQQMKQTENELVQEGLIEPALPSFITFLHTEDLQSQYPDLTPKEREDLVAEKYGAVFLIGIGNKLANGEPHDGRAPDYDDWSTPTGEGYTGLNGDILLWHPALKQAFEVSSMGIRVDAAALERQLTITHTTDRKNHSFHAALLNNALPLSIGGGIGQSRLCMFLLRKKYIGEVQYCD